MKITLYGAGRLAHSMLPALLAAGHEVLGVWSRRFASAQTLASRYGVRALERLEVPAACEVGLLCVADAAVQDVASRLCASIEEGACVGKVLLLHTAGSVPLFTPSTKCETGVLYPLMTFSKERVVPLRELTLFVEGATSEALARTRGLAESLTPHVVEMSSEARERLHLAGVIANNFANHCFHLAATLLEEDGVEPQALLPMLREMVNKLEVLTPAEAQTGPAVRGDAQVLARHEALLADRPQLQALYQLMSQSIQKLNKI